MRRQSASVEDKLSSRRANAQRVRSDSRVVWYGFTNCCRTGAVRLLRLRCRAIFSRCHLPSDSTSLRMLLATLFGKPVTNATMDARAEGEMLPYLGTINDEFIGALDLVLVPIAGDVPHHHLVTLGDPTAT